MANDHDDASHIEAAVAGGHDVHGAHDPLDPHGAHDDDAGHGGHGADPNAHVVVAEAPTPAWVMTAAAIAALTIAVCVVLAVMLHNAADSGAGAEEAPAHGLAPITLTFARV
ncbi:MAG: hypothetical protein ABIM89_18875 [Mycobacteriales bacterium]